MVDSAEEASVLLLRSVLALGASAAGVVAFGSAPGFGDLLWLAFVSSAFVAVCATEAE